jgi:hypothetical protein
MVKKVRTRYLPIVSVLFSVVLAYGLDQLYFSQSRAARLTSDYAQLYIWEMAIGLFLIVIWLALGWITLVRSQQSVLVSVIFLALGFLIYCYPYLYIMTAWSWLPPIFRAFHTPLSYTGIFIFVLGVLHLFLPTNNGDTG